ncbi:MAG: NAD(P)/FAD-dependent oxidoreductase [Pyrinomonadaceae bacterium]
MSNKTNYFDVIIIGGGPAGMSAAIRCAELGIDAILLERGAELGGQLLWTYNAIDNYSPFKAKNGRELRDHFLRRIENVGAKYLTNSPVAHADLREKIITLANGERFSAKSIILATGVRRRRLNVPGEKEFQRHGILESGIKDKEKVRGKTVVIVGGGDAAVENACILGEVAQKVYVVHRRDQFTAQTRFVDRVYKLTNVSVVFDSRVTSILGDTKVGAVDVQNLMSGDHSTIPAEAVLIRIGVVPNTELFAGQIDVDHAGFALPANGIQTNVSEIYAVGDLSNPNDLTVQAAAKSGTESARRTKI